MTTKYRDKYTLVVSTSDLYSSALKPFFELIKIYWKDYPQKIILNTENNSYYDKELNIRNSFSTNDTPWSKRLYDCLKNVDTEYILFCLEDFFLLGNVDTEMINKCLDWMDENSNIAEFRLKTSNDNRLVYNEKYYPFRTAGSNVGFRLDTQAAIWRKKSLMSFLKLDEDPWHFETDGTKRIINSKELFLWHYNEDDEDINAMIFPYHIKQNLGFGIAWGHWLWNNKQHFIENGIEDVDYNILGTLSKRQVEMRFKYLYRVGMGDGTFIEKLIQKLYRIIVRIKKVFRIVKNYGIKKLFVIIKNNKKL